MFMKHFVGILTTWIAVSLSACCMNVQEQDQTTISSPPGTYRAAFHFAAAQVRKGLSAQWVLHFREHPARLAGISDLLNFFMDKRG